MVPRAAPDRIAPLPALYRDHRLKGLTFEVAHPGAVVHRRVVRLRPHMTRLAAACKSATCAAGSDKVEFAYDGESHRTQLKATSAAGAVATTDSRYQGDAIVEERLTDATHAGLVVRSYVVDEAGAIVKVTIPAGEPDAGTYLALWTGHGDALNLNRLNADGSLTLANSYRYGTWGAPATTTHNGIGDLGFRFLYVGRSDVEWDNAFGLGLAYMHARHYAPALGRFLSPDPEGVEDNQYAYVVNNPVTQTDPGGTCFILCVIVNAVVDTAIYLATTDSSEWSVGGVVGNATVGFVTGFVGVGLLSKVAKVGKIASALSRVGGFASRGAAAISRSSRLGAAVVRRATRVAKVVARDQRDDWIRFGRTRVSNQLLKGPGVRGSAMRRAVSGGGPTKTGITLPFHYHVGLYNLTRPSTWFRQTWIL